MQFNTKLIMLIFIAGILTLILVSFFTFNEQDPNQPQTNSRQKTIPSQITSIDPFKEFLDTQQQEKIIRLNSTQRSQTLIVTKDYSSNGIIQDANPFKTFLDEQDKAKKAASVVSPFSGNR